MVGLISLPVIVLAKNSIILTRTPEVETKSNSQMMPLLAAALNSNPVSTGGPSVAIVDNTTLSAESDEGRPFLEGGHLGTGQISVYVVHSGDTIGSVAQLFGVSANTIRWANNLTGNKLKVGQELVILPISGVRHTVKSGDTLQSIAKKYKADLGDILAYNNLERSEKLSLGQEIIIPDGEMSSVSSSRVASSGGSNTLKEYSGYYLRPIAGGKRSQHIHGHNAVDLAAPVGTPIMASADGVVIISRTGGWNGGYGVYVAISHANGTQTVYGHMKDNYVSVGQRVSQGEVIGNIGTTGNTSGPHIHFEIRGARNPF